MSTCYHARYFAHALTRQHQSGGVNRLSMALFDACAEGVNMQFCSLVINYHLPWNPQRIEQRIGRCHRYGQKHDVVINFLNERNTADRRVHELLDQKFNLFSRVFGTSDGVLGQIESGVDFERRILAVYEQCRTPEQIDAAFLKLKAEMDETIQARMDETRQILMEHFDEDVHARLKMHLDDAPIPGKRFGSAEALQELYDFIEKHVGFERMEEQFRGGT